MSAAALLNTAASQTAQTGQPAAKPNAFNKLAENFDSFLKLLTAQLQNQDPSEPLDTNQFTQQLVQFAGVEQQIRTNSNIDKLVAASNANRVASTLDYIGKAVEVKSNTFELGEAQPKLIYELEGQANEVMVKIFDKGGNVVRTIYGNSEQKEAGAHEIVWDGKNDAGTAQANGVYRFQVLPLDRDKNPIGVNLSHVGKVTQVEMDGGDAFIYVGSVKLKTDDIRRVAAA
ncbi:MAG TPA: flagellar hook assembly protein FlgD [Alphaproteobacteria bacterium]|nr:flagellar hook assembly protein FlgD [Alphaproteobacteria bacterium]